MRHDVAVFTPYVFSIRQRIRIEMGRRKGDWEIAAIGDHTVTLRCPISKKEFEWAQFCYLAAEMKDEVWPQDS